MNGGARGKEREGERASKREREIERASSSSVTVCEGTVQLCIQAARLRLQVQMSFESSFELDLDLAAAGRF